MMRVAAFARLLISEMKLYNKQKLKQGRSERIA